MSETALKECPQHPLYLDVPMMINFLAALEDGISFERTELKRVRGLKATEREGHGKLGGTVVTEIVGIDVGGSQTGNSESEESEELQLVRWHTEASLFNRLRELLYANELVRELGISSESDALVEPGMIVEINGVVLPNPLEELVGIASRFRPFIQVASTSSNSAPDRSTRRERSQAGKAQSADPGVDGSKKTSAPKQSLDVFAMLNLIQEDLDSSTMSDILLSADSEVYSKAVLTVKKNFGTDVGADGLIGAKVGVLGKVTAVNASGAPVHMLRRSVFRTMSEDQLDSTFASSAQFLREETPGERLVVRPPLIQIMPLAIFI